ncbi:MAG: helix-turn-helix domain-containing protein [Candidatus Thermoplasmatota archaeon]
MSRAPTAKSALAWEQVAAELSDVGVPDDQARVYVQLLRRGPSPASDLAQVLAISRPQAYRLLEALAEAGFVTAGIGRPRLFAAAAPDAVLRSLRERSQRTLAHLDRVRDLLASRLGALRKQADEADDGPHFTVVRGVDALSSAAKDLCHAADERIDVLVGDASTKTLFGQVLGGDLLAEKARGGVGIRLLLPPGIPAQGRDVPLQRRHLDHDSLASLVLADGRDALMVLDPVPAGRVEEATLGVRTNAAPFVSTQALLFESLWVAAQERPPRRA